VGAGGDGTLREIAGALEATDTALGIIPTGCCNDFARAVGLHRSDSPERLAGLLLQGRQQAVDLGGVGPHRFLTVATFGFASAVNRFVEGRRFPSRGTLAYLYGVLRLLPRYHALPVTLRGDFGERSGSFLLAAVGNTPSFAGNLPITPGAVCGDGLFQVCLVRDVNRFTLLAALGRLFRGTHLDHPAVHAINTRFLEIDTPSGPSWICADGESLCQTPCRLEVRPKALRVVGGGPGLASPLRPGSRFH
jgi:diacylglycerol kinase (ATP)